MTLIDKFSFFAVCVNVDPGSNDRNIREALCAKVHSEVLAAVRVGLESTHKTECQIETGFLCPVHTSEPEQHTASIHEFDQTKWICNKKSQGTLSDYHTVWLCGPGIYLYKSYGGVHNCMFYIHM